MEHNYCNYQSQHNPRINTCTYMVIYKYLNNNTK
ncbi:hypothetical protein BMR1_01G03257 [Babesia microti strain RI]|uniref:Uncharacterized protein n=1 Tax=Babesia microti (strain RI) TaxID=1133968 RepID=I7J5Q2_BABMR|nr:hypothetical protein BMR1_01G03257 [Babesia microti strain RI]CCF73107.1 hypothetical protein BMR1_01G03257 [Babesia microti strain RI]|eukprot:XP_012647716.1 hypothetical protein BMR1_01G03257 [Babesia microti strain RI]